MTAKTPAAVCDDCGQRAIAGAYGTLLCIGCYPERGFDDPALLGGRRPATTDDEGDDDC